MLSKYTLHPTTSSGRRIQMPWDDENDPTQDEIDGFAGELKTPSRAAPQTPSQITPQITPQRLPQVQAPPVQAKPQQPNAVTMLTRSRMNEQENQPVHEPDTYGGGFVKGLKDYYRPAAKTTMGELSKVAHPTELRDLTQLAVMGELPKFKAPKALSQVTERPPLFNRLASEVGEMGSGGGPKDPALADKIAKKLARVKLDPNFQKLDPDKQAIILKHLEDNAQVLPEVKPLVEAPPPGVSKPRLPFQDTLGPTRDSEVDLVTQAKLFGPKSLQAGTKNIPRVAGPIDKVSPRIQQSDLLADVTGKGPVLHRGADAALNVLHGSRTLLASADLSAPARQGAFLVGRKEYWKALPDMFKAAHSEKGYQQVLDSIETHPHFQMAERSGVAFTDLSSSLSDREEKFMNTIADKIPLVRGSARAYTAFLNKLRMDVFGSMVDGAKVAAKGDATEFQKMIPYIADYVNAASGRGGLGKFEKSAKVLNATLFAPRLMASRLKIINPLTYTDPRIPKFVRQEAIKDLLKFSATATGTLYAASQVPGVTVEVDPRSADFGKIRAHNTRFDMLAGIGQYIRLGSQLASKQTKSTNTGQIRTLGSTPVTPTRLDVLGNFLKNKEAPIPSYITEYLSGKDMTGQPFNASTEVVKRFAPMLLQDAYEVFQTDRELMPLTVPAGIMGIGVQSYKPGSVKKQPSKFAAGRGKKSRFD